MSDLRVDGCGDAGTPSQRDPESSSSSAPPLAARLVEPPLAQLRSHLIGIDALLRNAFAVADGETALRLAGSLELVSDALTIGEAGRLVDPSPPQKIHEDLESRMDTPGSAIDSLTAPTNEVVPPLEETLWEELGGDLCVCQRAEVPHWCESCQRKLQLIREAFKRLYDRF